MAGIAGRGTTYNLPNYHGMLIGITPEDTPFTSAIGGILGGIKTADATEFEWQTYDLRAADQATRVRLEGADAPAAEERVRANVKNVLEIHQEAVDVSYTKLAATGARAGLNVVQAGDVVLDEFTWQVAQQVKQVKRDVEYSFLRGAYQLPADNTTPRKTRGLLEAIVTNVSALAATPDLTSKHILDLLQLCFDNGGIQESETATLISNSVQKRWITKRFITDMGYREETRNVGGVSLTTIVTDFGRINTMLNRYMPQDQVVVCSLEQCKPVGLEVPGKGVFFVEPLAKTGASEKCQLYGEFGLEYGSERKHGKITGLGVNAPV